MATDGLLSCLPWGTNGIFRQTSGALDKHWTDMNLSPYGYANPRKHLAVRIRSESLLDKSMWGPYSCNCRNTSLVANRRVPCRALKEESSSAV